MDVTAEDSRPINDQRSRLRGLGDVVIETIWLWIIVSI
jgi:hypothetical protein